MSQFQRRAIDVLSGIVGRARTEQLANAYRSRVLVPAEAATYAMSHRGRTSADRLREMAGSYSGDRCFIIGNGPSLAKMDLSRLRGEQTFGLNRGYLLFDRIGAPTSFLVTVNSHVVRQFGDELSAAGVPMFVSWRVRRWLRDPGDVIYIRRGRPFSFSRDLARDGAWEGATVTFMAMQLAYHLGFKEVILIGVDHSFVTPGPANKLVTADAPDPNHFDPAYFGPGVQWQLPDLAVSEMAYRIAKGAFEADGRRIIDATVDGKLTVFPKADFSALTGSGDRSAVR